MTVVIVVGTLGFIALVWAAVFFFYYKKRQRAKYLAENGVKGKAVVKSLNQTGVYINNIPQIVMGLEVSVPNAPVYQITKTVNLPMIYYPRVQPGMTIDVVVDPARLSDQKYLGLVFE